MYCAQTHTRAHTHTRTHTQTQITPDTRTHTQFTHDTHTHTCTHNLPPTRTHAHTHTQFTPDTDTHTHSLPKTHTHTHSPPRRAHTHTHAHTTVFPAELLSLRVYPCAGRRLRAVGDRRAVPEPQLHPHAALDGRLLRGHVPTVRLQWDEHLRYSQVRKGARWVQG